MDLPIEKLRGQARSFPDWHTALSQLLANMARPPFSEWAPRGGPGWELASWDDPRHRQGTVLPMDSSTSYVERTVAIHWDRATVHCAQYDMKTGAGDDTYDFTIPTDWLEPMKKLPWPITGASSPF